MLNMIDERSRIENLDNLRYTDIQWVTVKDVIVQHQQHMLKAKK